jgi:flagellar protein FlbD
MISLTRLNKQTLVLNSDLIKLIEFTPDTVVTLVNGEKVIVLENREQILERIVEFRRRVLDGLALNFSGWTATGREGGGNNRQSAPPEEQS